MPRQIVHTWTRGDVQGSKYVSAGVEQLDGLRAADRACVTVAEMVRITGFPRHWLYRRVTSTVPPRVVGRVAELDDLSADGSTSSTS